ncbi:hypothetical protein PIB30_027465 [Stylosanthes scabra]|uniref:Uncharacterized protein n=1 Tax=Stylosanthes scabra TaxID=79078 RepID=A0ABU6Z7P0_9FABA|nr:hypothetical protein [Stylosanthes scabra]
MDEKRRDHPIIGHKSLGGGNPTRTRGYRIRSGRDDCGRRREITSSEPLSPPLLKQKTWVATTAAASDTVDAKDKPIATERNTEDRRLEF